MRGNEGCTSKQNESRQGWKSSEVKSRGFGELWDAIGAGGTMNGQEIQWAGLSGFDGQCVGSQWPAQEKQKRRGYSLGCGCGSRDRTEFSHGSCELVITMDLPLERPRAGSLRAKRDVENMGSDSRIIKLKVFLNCSCKSLNRGYIL